MIAYREGEETVRNQKKSPDLFQALFWIALAACIVISFLIIRGALSQMYWFAALFMLSGGAFCLSYRGVVEQRREEEERRRRMEQRRKNRRY